MFSEKKLKDSKVAVLAADGFEKVELSVPVAALKAAGADVDIVSLRHGRIRGVNLHEPASRVKVDKMISEAAPSEYDALFIPGGLLNPDLLRQSAEARQFVREFDAAQKPIASICHGPWVMASADLLRGRTLTSWPGVRDDMVNAGATWLDEPVVRHGNLLTSRGPQDMVPFVKALIPFFAGGEAEVESRPLSLNSAPQREAPPELVIGAMKWLPRPSLRTAALIGAAVAVYMASNSRKAPLQRSRAGRLRNTLRRAVSRLPLAA